MKRHIGCWKCIRCCICTFVPCKFVPHCNKFRDWKGTKNGRGPASKSTRQTFLVAKLKRKKTPIYFHYWPFFLVFLIFVADPLWWNVVGRWWLSCIIWCMDWNKSWAVVANSIQLCAKIPRKNSIRYATEVGCLRCLGMARNVFIMSRYSQN